jgi:DNA-binding transcriptional MerR regulator
VGGPVSGEQSHLSIGEVLGLLQEEFPDVTISKIRFLEAQGLLDPERSPSGYRKFREDDIDRIRWILLQQRDHFLPLKVIKERLASGDLSSGVPEGVLPLARRSDSDDQLASVQPSVQMRVVGSRSDLVSQLVEAPAEISRHNLELIAEEDERGRHPAVHVVGDPSPESPSHVSVRPSGADLSLEDLARESGLTLRELGDLERFGLITTRSIGQVTYYDDEALIVARLAAGFHRHGIETRHLRMFKVGAEREAALFEQLITPLLRKRTAEAREQAVATLEDLAELADDLRASMVRTVLRDYLGSS